MDRVAVIDVGSNGIKIFVGESADDGTVRTVLDTNNITRLGEGLDATGLISADVMQRNVDAVTEFAARARSLGAGTIVCVGTMALRNAGNSAEFADRVRRSCGIDVRIISGEEEARLSYLAVLSGLRIENDEELVVFDTGGGSTEFIYGRGPAPVRRFSVNTGAVRITENYLKSDPVTADEVAAAIDRIDGDFAGAGVDGHPQRLVGLGGAVTTMGAVKLRMPSYDPRIIQGSWLSKADVEAQIAEYSARTIARRRQLPGLQPGRADVILAGACIVKVITDRLGADGLTISHRGLRHGLAFELLRG